MSQHPDDKQLAAWLRQRAPSPPPPAAGHAERLLLAVGAMRREPVPVRRAPLLLGPLLMAIAACLALLALYGNRGPATVVVVNDGNEEELAEFAADSWDGTFDEETTTYDYDALAQEP